MTATALRLAQPGLPPLDYHIQDFLHAKATKADSTVDFYEVALRQFREHVGPHYWPVTDSAINSYLAACKKRGCKDGTLHAYYRTLRTWLNWLHRRGVISPNPIDLVEEPPQPKPLPKAPPEEDLEKLLAVLDPLCALGNWLAIRDRALLGLALDTGLRVSEVARLWVGDVDLKNRQISVARFKTHEGGMVVFSKDAGGVLSDYIQTRFSLGLPLAVQALFVSDRRAALTASGLRQILKRRLKQAGVTRFNFHRLRHAYAILTLRNGGDLADIQAQLGHKNLATTAIYLKAEPAGRGKRHARSSPLAGLKKRKKEE